MMEQDGLGQAFNVAGQLLGSGAQAASGAIAATIGFAEQILNLTVHVGEQALPFTFKAAKFAAKDVGYDKMLKGMAVLGSKGMTAHYKHKHGGSVKLKTLLKSKGEEIACFRFPEEKAETVLKALQDRGVLYYTVPDLNEKDGMTEVMFHEADAERVNALSDRLGLGQVIGVEEYLHNADPETLEKAYEEAKEEAQKEGKTPRIKKLERDRKEAARQNTTAVTANKETLLLTETEEHVVIKVPGEEKFFSVSKADAEEMEGGESLRLHLGNDTAYTLIDREGNEAGSIKGKDLANAHFHSLEERREHMRTLNASKGKARSAAQKPAGTGKVPVKKPVKKEVK